MQAKYLKIFFFMAFLIPSSEKRLRGRPPQRRLHVYKKGPSQSASAPSLVYFASAM